MRLQRQAERAVVVDDMLAERHGRQLRLRLVVAQADRRLVEQRQSLGGTLAVQRAHRPKRLAAVEAERAEGVGLGKPLDVVDIEARAQPEIAHGLVAGAAPLDESLHASFRQALDLAEAEPHGMTASR